VNGVSLITFLLAVYLPHAFFKIWAERYVDLGRRRDTSQFDEIVAPVLPSTFLHLQSWLIVHSVCLIHNLVLPTRWEFPGPDWRLVLTISNEASIQRVGEVLNDWDALMWPIGYVTVLAFTTFINGLSFGRGALIGLYTTADPELYPGARALVTPRTWWSKVKIYVGGVAFWMWKLFYYENFVSLFPWTVLKPFVFVKTKDGELFHGRFQSYEKTRDGQIDTVTIGQASRFTRRSIREALRDGEHPLRPLKGVLLIKWHEIVDINTTVPEEIRELWKRWEALRVKDRPPQI
jgi:hypothetical protein